jgi:SET domain-containing protein
VQEVDALPHLFLFASKHIKKGEEVLFDYGDRSAKVTDNNPWLNS